MKRLKNRIRVISLLIACSLILGCTVSATNSSASLSAEELAALPEDIRYALLNDQSEALSAYNKLAHYLGLDTLDFNGIWPDEYAGCYINDNNQLIICLTTITPEFQQKYTSICKANVGFQLSKYSQHDIAAMYNILTGYSRADKLLVRYSNKNNKLVIQLDDANEQTLLEQYIDEYYIHSIQRNNFTKEDFNATFNEMVRYDVQDNTDKVSSSSLDPHAQTMSNTSPARTTAVRIGSEIHNKKEDSATGLVVPHDFTLGIWATRIRDGDRKLGFITCAHAFCDYNYQLLYDQDTRIVYINDNTPIGEIIDPDTDLYYGGNYDCSFVELTNSNYAPSIYLTTAGTIRQYHIGIVCEGTAVCISGSTSGLMRGVIEENAYDYYVSSLGIASGYLIAFPETDTNGNPVYQLQRGDSGGPAYYVDTTTYSRILFGFQSSGYNQISHDVFEKAEVSRADLAFSALGATIYTG